MLLQESRIVREGSQRVGMCSGLDQKIRTKGGCSYPFKFVSGSFPYRRVSIIY